MTHYLTIDTTGDIILDNLKSECKFCFENCTSKGKLKEDCIVYDHKRRIGIIKNTRGTTFYVVVLLKPPNYSKINLKF